jgi:hypothetical protein
MFNHDSSLALIKDALASTTTLRVHLADYTDAAFVAVINESEGAVVGWDYEYKLSDSGDELHFAFSLEFDEDHVSHEVSGNATTLRLEVFSSFLESLEDALVFAISSCLIDDPDDIVRLVEIRTLQDAIRDSIYLHDLSKSGEFTFLNHLYDGARFESPNCCK